MQFSLPHTCYMPGDLKELVYWNVECIYLFQCRALVCFMDKIMNLYVSQNVGKFCPSDRLSASQRLYSSMVLGVTGFAGFSLNWMIIVLSMEVTDLRMQGGTCCYVILTCIPQKSVYLISLFFPVSWHARTVSIHRSFLGINAPYFYCYVTA